MSPDNRATRDIDALIRTFARSRLCLAARWRERRLNDGGETSARSTAVGRPESCHLPLLQVYSVACLSSSAMPGGALRPPRDECEAAVLQRSRYVSRSAAGARQHAAAMHVGCCIGAADVAHA